MISPDDSDQVLDALGDKFLGAVGLSVRSAREDLAEARVVLPSWFPSMHPRTLANIIHDRLWDHLVAACVDDHRITFVDRGPVRQVLVGFDFVLRVKRHDAADFVQNYDTSQAMQFWANDPSAPPLPGLEVITLAVGYRWDAEQRDIGAPVISYRTAKNAPVWCVELDEPVANEATVTWTPIEPTSPDIVIDGVEDDQEEGSSQA